MTVTLKTSVGATLSSTLNPVTARRIVEIGDGTVTTAGASGFDVVTLLLAKDAAYSAATSEAPVALGIDNILFRPLFYPEAL